MLGRESRPQLGVTDLVARQALVVVLSWRPFAKAEAEEVSDKAKDMLPGK